MILPEIQSRFRTIQEIDIPEERLMILEPLVHYIQHKVDSGKDVNLNFICTHNSRRSQFSQVWSQVAAHVFGFKAKSFSGGVEVTAFNQRAIASLKRSGFKIENDSGDNPRYKIYFAEDSEPILGFSKLFDDEVNPKTSFAAIMTCSHADENCPFIPGTEKRIPLNYEDPKAFDDMPEEAEMYDQRSMQIASELLFVFGKIKRS